MRRADTRHKLVRSKLLGAAPISHTLALVPTSRGALAHAAVAARAAARAAAAAAATALPRRHHLAAIA